MLITKIMLSLPPSYNCILVAWENVPKEQLFSIYKNYYFGTIAYFPFKVYKMIWMILHFLFVDKPQNLYYYSNFDNNKVTYDKLSFVSILKNSIMCSWFLPPCYTFIWHYLMINFDIMALPLLNIQQTAINDLINIIQF